MNGRIMKEMTGYGNPERARMLQAIEGKSPKDMSDDEYAFYKAEQERKQAKLEEQARRMEEKRQRESDALSRKLGGFNF